VVKDIRDYSLLGHNTFGIDAKCSRFLEYADETEARQVAAIVRDAGLPYLIVGGGSNLLLTRDFEGIVVHSAMKGCEVKGTEMTCGSGMVWDEVVALSLDAELYGMENLSLIPGDVGASAVQNIGAYGVEAKDLIVRVEAVEIATGEIRTFDNADCQYAYRDSRFKHDWKNGYLMLRVTYQLSTEFRPRLDYGNIRAELERKGMKELTAWQLRETIIDIRRQKLPDPEVMGNAGSFFMNPVVSREKYERLARQYEGMPHYTIDAAREKIPAGWLIDQCGWKGRSLGRAGVHSRQALVLVNLGGATGNEIVALCEQIRHDVRERFDIDIHPEVNIV
jgi:UDP-N-acetylmuramate dehydrogenase